MKTFLKNAIATMGKALVALIAILALVVYLDAVPAKEKGGGGGGGGGMRGGGGGGGAMRGGGGGGMRGGGMTARPPKAPSFGGGGGGGQVPRLNPGSGGVGRSPMKPPSYGQIPGGKTPRNGGGNWGGGGHGGGGHGGGGHGGHDGHHDHDDDDYYYFGFGYYPWYSSYYRPYYYSDYYYPYYAYPEVNVYPQVIVPEPVYYPPGRYYPETKYYPPAPESGPVSSGGPTQGVGWEFLSTGQPEQALSAFKMEAGDNPGLGVPLIGQALAYLEMEHPIDAAKFFAHALKLDPNAFAQIRLETTLRSILENRVAMISGNPTPNLENDSLDLACLHYLLGRSEAARAEAERAKGYEQNAGAVGNLILLIDAMSQPQTGAAG